MPLGLDYPDASTPGQTGDEAVTARGNLKTAGALLRWITTPLRPGVADELANLACNAAHHAYAASG